jgi:hypothetical protein
VRPDCDRGLVDGGSGRSPDAHGRSGGRAVAPGRGADLRRQGGVGGGPTKVRGAAAREPKATARGAARGKRAAPMRLAMTARRTATNGSGALVMPLVALAKQFAALSAERGPTDMSNPCEVGARRREPRANEQGGGLGGSRGAVRCAAAHCEQRAADARAGVRGARRLRCGRGEGETCGRDAVAERRCTRRIRVGRRSVRPRKALAPKAQLSCVARTKVIRSGALPACENRARGNARSHGAAGHDSFRCGLRCSHRRHACELRGRAET